MKAHLAALALTAAAALAPATAWAEYVLFGNGQSSCNEYLAAADAERKVRAEDSSPDLFYTNAYIKFVAWADGYLTGINRLDAAAPRVGEMTDHATRQAWISTWCRKNPLGPYVGALAALRAELQTLPR
jgi:hypothetical protein